MSEENSGNWRDSLPEELRGAESLSSFEDVGALAKSFIETKKMVGNAIRIPGEDAGDEDRAAFRAKILEKTPELMARPDFEDLDNSREFWTSLGVPEDPTGYDPIEVEGASWSEDQVAEFNELAHKANLTKAQRKTLLQEMLSQDKTRLVEGQSNNAEQFKKLRQEWGLVFDERLALAQKVRETFLDFIPEEQMDATTTAALYNIGKQLTGGNPEIADLNRSEAGSGRMAPGDAKAAIAEIYGNKEHPYWHSHHPDHQSALERMVELQTLANPDAGTSLPRVGFSS